MHNAFILIFTGVLEIKGVDIGGTVTIMGKDTRHYVCVTDKGIVRGQVRLCIIITKDLGYKAIFLNSVNMVI